MKKYAIRTALLMTMLSIFAGCDSEQTWIKQSGTSQRDLSYDVAVDGVGGVYMVGSVQENLFGPAGDPGVDDAVLVKYNRAGQLLWGKQWGGFNHERATTVTTDAELNVIVAGTQASDTGIEDVFIRKFDGEGELLWSQVIEGPEVDEVYDIVVDAQNNIFLAGTTLETVEGQTSAGNSDLFLSKLSPTGEKLWTRQFGAQNTERAYGIALDDQNNIYVTGYTASSLFMDNPMHRYDAFLAKFNPEGELLQGKQFRAGQDSKAYSVYVAPNNNVYITGSTYGPFPGQTGAGRDDLFIIALDESLEELWLRQWGTTYSDEARRITGDGQGNLYISGSTGGSLDGNTSARGWDIFLSKFSVDGAREWTKQLGGTPPLSQPLGVHDQAWGLALDKDGSIFVSGGTATSLPGNRNKGNLDMFLLKYNP